MESIVLWLKLIIVCVPRKVHASERERRLTLNLTSMYWSSRTLCCKLGSCLSLLMTEEEEERNEEDEEDWSPNKGQIG